MNKENYCVKIETTIETPFMTATFVTERFNVAMDSQIAIETVQTEMIDDLVRQFHFDRDSAKSMLSNASIKVWRGGTSGTLQRKTLV